MRVSKYSFLSNNIDELLRIHTDSCNFQKIVFEVVENVLTNFSHIQRCMNEIKQKAKESNDGKIGKKGVKEVVQNSCKDVDFKMFNLDTQSMQVRATKNGVYENVLTSLIKNISNLEGLSLHSNATRTKGFFGYKSKSGDLFYKDATIELKYMRQSNGKYEIRNALGQTLENAKVIDCQNAILLVWDEAYLNEDWDTKSEKYISMFINNPFRINFAVIRIRVYKNHNYCGADIYI